MTGMIRLGWQRMETYLPEVGIRRNLLWVVIVNIFVNFRTEENREYATMLALKSRLQEDSSYIRWIKTQGDLRDLNSEGYKNLLEDQRQDLINKMGAVACFYITKDLSVHTSISRLLAGSEKISKIAQPVLDKMTAFASLSFLQSTALIVLTPILLQLAHMALTKIDPQCKIDLYSRLKTFTNQASNLLELLIYLRLSLVCLGICQSLGGFFFATLIDNTFSYLLSDQKIQRLLLLLQPSLRDIVFELDDDSETNNEELIRVISLWRDLVMILQQRLLNCFLLIDIMPKIGIEKGFNALNATFSRRADGSDTKVLEKLFQATFNISMNLKERHTLCSEIKQAQDTRSISTKHAHALTKIVNVIEQETALMNNFVKTVLKWDAQKAKDYIHEQLLQKNITLEHSQTFLKSVNTIESLLKAIGENNSTNEEIVKANYRNIIINIDNALQNKLITPSQLQNLKMAAAVFPNIILEENIPEDMEETLAEGDTLEAIKDLDKKGLISQEQKQALIQNLKKPA